MDLISLFGISIGLAMDAFAVSVSNGASCHCVSLRNAVKTGLFFGLFQALMPMIGWLTGTAFTSFISGIDHWIALILLGYLGGKMLSEALEKIKMGKQSCGCLNQDDIQCYPNTRTLFTMAIATSIDALATGLLLPSAVGASTPILMLVSVSAIGIITFALSFLGVLLGKKCGKLFSNKAEVFGGIVLIGIGIKIFIEHMFF